MGPKFIRNLEAHLRQAEGRRPKAWERERSEQHSTRSVFISEWTLAGGPYVYSTQSTLARSIFINTRGQLSLREIQKSWGKLKKKSRKSPEKVQKKSRKKVHKKYPPQKSGFFGYFLDGRRLKLKASWKHTWIQMLLQKRFCSNELYAKATSQTETQ